MTECWFRYRDEARGGKSFYFNAVTQEVRWLFPTENATVWDAQTKRKLRLPSMKGQKKAAPPSPRSSSPRRKEKPKKKNSSDESSESSESSSSSESTESSTSSYSEPPPTGPEVPDYSKDLVKHYAELPVQFSKFESSLMNKLKKDSFQYSDKALDNSILNTLKKPEAKIAVKYYRLVMKLTGVPSNKVKGDLIDLVKACKENPFMVDEVYAELWKQTTNAPANSLNLGLQVFVVMATLFRPTQELQKYLLNHVAKLAQNVEYARFVLIRLDEICAANGPTLNIKEDKDILEIQNHINGARYYFGVSPYEMFWHQRKSRSHCPIPYAEYQMLDVITRMGGRDKSGIFRASGNQGRLVELCSKANRGEEFLSGENLDDIASLFKRWLRDVPGRLVKASKAKEWAAIKTEDDVIAFVNELEKPVQMILKYLIGFLREIAANSSVNEMDQKNIASAFGPNITFENDDDPLAFQKQQQFFIVSLLSSWDVSEVYPVDPGQLRLSH